MEEEKPKEMTLRLMPDLLYRPLYFMGYSKPDPKASFQLYDRVVNVRSGISVPLGLKGVIIGVHIDEAVEVNTVYDVLFDEEFPGGVALRCSLGRGYKMSGANLINLTYGASKSTKAKTSKDSILNSALQPNRRNQNEKRTSSQAQASGNGHYDRRNGNACRDEHHQPVQILQRQNQRPRLNVSPKKHEKQKHSTPMMTVDQLESSMRPPSPKHAPSNGSTFRRISPSLLMSGNKNPVGSDMNGQVTPMKKPENKATGVTINDILRNAHQSIPPTVHVATPRPKTQAVKTGSFSAPAPQTFVKRTTGSKAAQLSFVPTQVSRNSKATPAKPTKTSSATGVNRTPMMSVEALEEQLHRTDIQDRSSSNTETVAAASSSKTTISAKKRHAINL